MLFDSLQRKKEKKKKQIGSSLPRVESAINLATAQQ